jgi:hypothetical protein
MRLVSALRVTILAFPTRPLADVDAAHRGFSRPDRIGDTGLARSASRRRVPRRSGNRLLSDDIVTGPGTGIGLLGLAHPTPCTAECMGKML